MLGRLVEVLRGKNWEAALVEHIVAPLGLTHVAPSAYEAILFRAAVGHLGPGEDGVETPAPVWALVKSNEPAGSMLAMRPRDLVGFAQMHLDGGVAADGTRVLSEESVARHADEADRSAATDRDGRRLGPRLGDHPDGEPTVIGHDGGTIGQSAFLRVIPEAGLAVAMLTNGGDVIGPVRRRRRADPQGGRGRHAARQPHAARRARRGRRRRRSSASTRTRPST